MTSKFLRSMYNKTIIRFGFCDRTSTFIILDITKTSSNNCLETVNTSQLRREISEQHYSQDISDVTYCY